jgi:hypothetical protein
MKEFSHVAWMVVDTELGMDNAGQDRRGPDSGVKSVSHRTAFNNVMEVLKLTLGQFAGATTTMTFHDSLLTMLIPSRHPGMNPGAMNVKKLGNLGWGVPINAKQQGLQAQCDTGSLVGLGFLAQRQKFATSAVVGFCEDSVHGNECLITYAHIVLQGT